jgi:hypothetical protein
VSATYVWVTHRHGYEQRVVVEVESPGYVKVAYPLLAEMMWELGFVPEIDVDA